MPRYDRLPGDRRRWEEAGKSCQPSCSSQPLSSDDESDVEVETLAQYRYCSIKLIYIYINFLLYLTTNYAYHRQRTDEIIAALRTKLKEQAEQLCKTDHPKCLICMVSC